jgi:hypothetical protein
MSDLPSNEAATVRVSVAPSNEQIARRFADLVRKRPVLTIAAASAAGVVLGGTVLSRLGRFGAMAAAGYIANGLWRRERIDIRDLIASLSR